MSLSDFSMLALYASFGFYSIATILFGLSIRDKNKGEQGAKGKIESSAITVTIVGFLSQLTYFITRWIATGHAPVANLFEFTTFLGLSLVLAFIILYFVYRISVLGLFALPIALIIIVYASMFPTEVSPLVATLQSPFLWIHVITVSLSQGVLAVSFVAGLIYLIRSLDQTKLNPKNFFLEVVLYSLIILIGFILSSTTFNIMDYNAQFEVPPNKTVTYSMPAIVGPIDGNLITENVMEPKFTTPSWMLGADADRKFNTLIWSILTGTLIYLLFWVIFRKRIGAVVQPMLRKVNLDLMDEINYRSVAIGFPMFTLGGLIFAAIWAQIAWDRFWGWDPKEVWALITWFFYAAYLHLRLSRGWHGEKAAWLAVIGFAIIMFNLIVVNLVLAGLHSYA